MCGNALDPSLGAVSTSKANENKEVVMNRKMASWIMFGVVMVVALVFGMTAVFGSEPPPHAARTSASQSVKAAPSSDATSNLAGQGSSVVQSLFESLQNRNSGANGGSSTSPLSLLQGLTKHKP
jgi:flagellar basal body-associated protein FliL